MFERVSAEEAERQEALASRVRNELTAAGLPVLTPGLDRVLASGAEVEVDDGADAAGGVYVGWLTSPRLRECTRRAFRLRLLSDPLLRHSSEIAAAMMKSMAAILASAGFTVEDANDEYRSHQLRVTDGPAQAAPMWTLRDEEVAMSGWPAASPGDSAD
ncbi:hypothetical protein AB0H03_13555 [Streptomyces sparsogenes]|uniref:hypothetical protein n=1 Tax=Streptomyces sparsogenes TaxID=67365 RepID=UPI0033CE8849